MVQVRRSAGAASIIINSIPIIHIVVNISNIITIIIVIIRISIMIGSSSVVTIARQTLPREAEAATMKLCVFRWLYDVVFTVCCLCYCLRYCIFVVI